MPTVDLISAISVLRYKKDKRKRNINSLKGLNEGGANVNRWQMAMKT